MTTPPTVRNACTHGLVEVAPDGMLFDESVFTGPGTTTILPLPQERTMAIFTDIEIGALRTLDQNASVSNLLVQRLNSLGLIRDEASGARLTEAGRHALASYRPPPPKPKIAIDIEWTTVRAKFRNPRA